MHNINMTENEEWGFRGREWREVGRGKGFKRKRN